MVPFWKINIEELLGGKKAQNTYLQVLKIFFALNTDVKLIDTKKYMGGFTFQT
jgi:hypothetical protein